MPKLSVLFVIALIGIALGGNGPEALTMLLDGLAAAFRQLAVMLKGMGQ